MVRRGSTGDSSSNDFSDVGGGSDTDTGSGVTGDSGSDTSFDSGGGADDDDDFGGGGGGGATGGDTDDDDDFGGDFDPNPSARDTGADSGNTVDDITGGGQGDTRSQSTGDSASNNQGGAGGSGTSARQTDEVTDESGRTNTDPDPDDAFTPGLGDSTPVTQAAGEADRGIGVTTQPKLGEGGILERSPRAQRDFRQEVIADAQLEPQGGLTGGLEEQFGAITGKEGTLANAVQQFQARIDRETPVDAFLDPEQYNITRSGGRLSVEFAQGVGRERVGEVPTPTEQRTQIAQDVAEGRAGVAPSDVTVTSTASGFEALLAGGSGADRTAITGAPEFSPDADGFNAEVNTRQQQSTNEPTSADRGELRSAVTRFGQQQLNAVRRREGGQTALDAAVEGFEGDTGIDLIPGEGDVVQGVERELATPGVGPLPGGILPTPAEAEEFGADAAATTAVGGEGPELRVFDATLNREEAAREFGGEFARRSAEFANAPEKILGTGRTVEAAGETALNLGAGFVARGVEEANIRGVDADTEQNLVEFGQEAGERGRESVVDATRAAVQGTEVAAERVQNNPAEALGTGAFFAGSALLGTAASTASTRLLSRLPDRVRSIRARRAADARVDFEDVTSERGAAGDLPQFDTDPSAPTAEAVREIEDRAADNPDVVLDAVDEDAALFQSTEADLGPGFEARRGSSELPGLFTSPDASPLRLDVGDDQSSSLLSTDVRLPRPSDFTSRDDRLAAFPGDRVEGFPDDATGSGRVPDGDGGFEPDPDTSGARFLDEEAEEGTAFVRPQGARTTELEAIFPPGSEFGQSGSLAVDLPSGRTVPVDVFQRADDLPDADGDGPLGGFLDDERGQATLGDDRAGGTVTIQEIDDELRRLRRRDRDRPDGDPTTPAVAGGGGGPTATDRDGDGDTDLLIDGTGESVAPTETTAPTESVPTVDELGAESIADFGRSLSSPQFEDTPIESLMSNPTAASTVGASSPFGGGSAPSSPGGPSSGAPSSPGGPSSGAPSSPGAPPSGAPSSPGAPSEGPPVFPTSPVFPTATPPTRPPRRLDRPEGDNDDDRREREAPVFEEQFFRAVGTAESLVLGTDAPGADAFSPPEAERNTEPEPGGGFLSGGSETPTVDDLEQGAADAVADLQGGGGGTMIERATGGTSALVDFSRDRRPPADSGGGVIEGALGAPDPAPEPDPAPQGERRSAVDELEQMEREGIEQGGDFFFGSLVGVDDPPAEPEPNRPPRRSEPDLDPDDDLGGVLL